jgi:hypothetical protein
VLILLRLTYITHAIFQISTKIKFLENMLAGLRGSRISGVGAGNSGFPDIPDLAQRLRVIKV